MAKSVEYLGHRIDANGLHPLDEKVNAVMSAPAPRDVKELRSFLGLVQYYQKFMQNLSTTLAPLHRLLRKEVSWNWGTKEEKAFQVVKKQLSSNKVLTHYDPKQSLTLACDASPYGLGAVLSHTFDDGTERPIAFASRSLTSAEKNYSQLDREALAIIFGTKKFHQYIYGRQFTLISDHKPLESIFNPQKGISQMASSRIQRWALTLSAYTYTIQYRKGSVLANADCMSRLPLPTSGPEPPVPGDTILLLESMEATPVKTQHIKQWTDKDPILSRVRNLVLHGWPETMESSDELAPYTKRKLELSVQNGCVLWGNRIVVPPQGRKRVIETLHEAHPGLSRMKSVARGLVWWPKMDSELEVKVNTCSVCQQTRAVPSEAKLHPWEWPEKPWSRLHIDYAGPFLGKMFLICIDAHSKWIEAFPVSSASSEVTIECLRQSFATHGLPETVVSDNGSCFTSEEFAIFMKRNGISHICVAPYHPASNGMAERAVQTFKNGMKRMTDGSINTRLSRFLFNYRNTPQATTGVSPAELLLARRPKSHLHLLHPDLNQTVKNKQEKQKLQHDKHAKDRQIQVGDSVYVLNFRPGDKWLSGVVTERTGPVSFQIRLMNSIVVRRHIDHIRLRHVQFEAESESMENRSQVPEDLSYQVIPQNVHQPQVAVIPTETVAPQLSTEVMTTPNVVTPAAEPATTQETTSSTTSNQSLRRSTRICKPPDRLNL